MKRITASLLLLIFVFSTKSCYPGVANAANEPVLDTDGDELLSGVEYNIVSGIWGAGGGGLDLGSPINQRCPKFVVQHGRDMEYGRPVIFYPANNDSVVYLSNDVKIVFVPGLDAYCRAGTTWKLDDYDPSSGKWWVATGTVHGDPGPQTLTSWFKIEKPGPLFYTLNFCPSVCDSCVTLCNPISRYSSEGQIRLGLDRDNGWPFIFIKASKAIRQVVESHSK